MRALVSCLLLLPFAAGSLLAADQPVATKTELGKKLFFDVNLSKNRTQSCATCHNPEHGFVDNRSTSVGKAVSLGDDGKSLGDRNAPSAAYARFSPDFHQNKKGRYVGGQFLDGREKDLAGQAGGPPLNPVEMGMPDKATVSERLQENADYVAAFKHLFGDTVFDKPDTAYAAMAESIGEFEKTDLFAPFDSRYDRYLRGEVELTDQESLGESLFFSNQFTNCNRCHQLKAFPGSEGETFSNYEFHNLGVPANQAVRESNGKGKAFIDNGLLEHPDVKDGKEAGKFKVPTLRNVAITSPYMHNGVFSDLKTVVLFYDKFNNRKRKLNPETGKPWDTPEVDGNLALEDEDFQAPALKDEEVDALVAFLKTLTDQRYEHLLEQKQHYADK
ncbi:cytochrome-c peroxidase [Thiothrix nivea]|uniref:Di-heme cytochrome c peroxidase n=1 Tax=Thiothrix nivea (strain ATCC 35100 / DSM 5205 / JP2) TaxID=870187 RepID=A0A656HB88_THINJ|nr:cytochrome c peroxidase [Thiothrix nivea]EIJ33627.1 Di-heme cytochrome c peroxidase [Thiothrix nivea DSM 5205]